MKNTRMSNLLTVSLPMVIVSVVLALGASAIAEGPGTGPCSNRSLFGDYGMQVEGTFLAQNVPLRTIVMVHFDGRGNSTSKSYVVLNGTPADSRLETGRPWNLHDQSGLHRIWNLQRCDIRALCRGEQRQRFSRSGGREAITFVGSRVN